MTERPPTSDQLRHDIDEGLTGDRSAASDPAAAPLGTDEEAAGAGPSGEEIAEARRLERAHGDSAHTNAASRAGSPAGDPAQGWQPSVMVLAAMTGLALAIAATLLVLPD